MNILLTALLVVLYFVIGTLISDMFSDKEVWFVIFLWPIFVTAYVGMRISTKILGWRV